MHTMRRSSQTGARVLALLAADYQKKWADNKVLAGYVQGKSA